MLQHGWETRVTMGIALLVALGCSDSSDSGDTESANTLTGCDGWHTAECKYAARCGGNFDECFRQKSTISCLPDADLDRCIEYRLNAMCIGEDVPVGCEEGEVADRDYAIHKCLDYIDVRCARRDECTPGSLEECKKTIKESLDCSYAIGVFPSYDQCIADTEALPCPAISVPESCGPLILMESDYPLVFDR